MKTPYRMDGRALDHKTLTALRHRAVARVQDGESPEEVTRALGFSRPCIYSWLALYRSGGWQALDARKRGGRKPLMTGKMVRWVYRTVTGGDPRQYKFPFALWTRSAIATLIQRRFGLHLSKNSVGRLLAQLGITPQKPLWRAYQQDPERVRRWLEEEYPRIMKEARRIGAEIWFEDESGLRSDYHAGTTWGLKGRTPVVPTTGARHRLNMFSAVNRRGKMRFLVTAQSVGARLVCRFVDRLMIGAKRPIFLIVDGHPAHKSAVVTRKIESYKGRLRLFFLPPYSPELNPDEGVWREVKAHHVGRAGIVGQADLAAKVLRSLRRLSRQPRTVRAFFHTPTTSYAA